MSQNYIPQTLADQVAELSRRIEALETGAKPLVEYSGATFIGSVTLAAGAASRVTSTLDWSDSSVTTNPGGELYLAIYVDTDNDGDYLWHSGASLSDNDRKLTISLIKDLAHLDNNNDSNRIQWRIVNNDASQHTYYLYSGFTYLGGGSSSSV